MNKILFLLRLLLGMATLAIAVEGSNHYYYGTAEQHEEDHNIFDGDRNRTDVVIHHPHDNPHHNNTSKNACSDWIQGNQCALSLNGICNERNDNNNNNGGDDDVDNIVVDNSNTTGNASWGTDEFCAPYTDCYDCDPCRVYSFTSCETCVTAGEQQPPQPDNNNPNNHPPHFHPLTACAWCATDASCFSTDRYLVAGQYAFPERFQDDYNYTATTTHASSSSLSSSNLWTFTVTCTAEHDYAFDIDTCHALGHNNNHNDNTATTVLYSDPLYLANQWVFDMIYVQDVWKANITGAGVGIRINDSGVQATHPDLMDKFDKESSCVEYLPEQDNNNGGGDALQQRIRAHGTSSAAIAAAAGNNHVCSVGVAPDATISSCRIMSSNGGPTTEETRGQAYLYAKMDNMDISNNSYERVVCRANEGDDEEDGDDENNQEEEEVEQDGSRRSRRRHRRRRRLQATCPFLPFAPPCQESSPCATVNWISPDPSLECEDEIIEYCTNRRNFERDVKGCSEFFDLYVDCDYAPSEEENDAIIEGVTRGRDGKGIIYIWAAGNYRTSGERLEMKGDYVNTRLSISVGGVGRDGLHAVYSAMGPSLFVSAPGGDSGYLRNFVTAFAGRGCYHAGSGTSWAAPVVSGVVALILQANPTLTWRDVKGILASTSYPVFDDNLTPREDGSEVWNAAGFYHSDRYGFGIVNASAAVEAAKTWQLFGPERLLVARSGPLNIPLPEYTNASDPVTSTATLEPGDPFITETVYLFVRLRHSSRGDLKITLTSPSGTTSVVHPSRRPENNFEETWKFATNKVWGESPYGNWTLSIEDENAGDVAKCIDNWDYFFLLEETRVNCQLLDRLQFCQEGGKNFLGNEISGPDDPRLRGLDGSTPAEACCSCSGGLRPDQIDDVLQDWMVSVYGRDRTVSVAPTENPTLAPTPIPTTMPSASPLTATDTPMATNDSSADSLSPDSASSAMQQSVFLTIVALFLAYKF